jgi:hypothetical protein
MDFIEGLLASNRVNCILVVVNKLTRYAHFLLLAHPFTVAPVADKFMDLDYKLHGNMPLVILTNHAHIFASNF